MRCNESGFEPIDVPDGRRGPRMRTTRDEDGRLVEVELAVGREGDNAFVVLTVEETITTETLRDIANDVLFRLRYACEVAEGDRRACPYCRGTPDVEPFEEGGGI